MKANTFPLRLPASLRAEAERLAAEDGTSLNQFVMVAVAEKLATIRTSDIFQRHRGRADWEWFDAFLAGGGGETPRQGDEIPPGFGASKKTAVKPPGFAEKATRFKRKGR